MQAAHVPAGRAGKPSKSGGVPVSLPGLGAIVRTSQVGALASPGTSAVIINGVTPLASGGGGREGPFSPMSIAGCKMWFDVFDASYTTSGSNVTGWTNKSGNSSATGTTGVLINQTTLMGKSSLRMSSGNLSMGSITYSTNFRNYFIVGNFVNQQQTVVGDDNTQIGGAVTCGYYSDIELNYPGRNGIVSSSPSGNFGTPCILSLSTSTGNVGIWVTGNSQTITTNNLTPTFFATGTAPSQIIGSAVGSDFYEIIVYDGIMTSLQRQQIEGYLAWKWGIQANLPSGHPYKTAAPT
jgi:hypothetical protein